MIDECILKREKDKGTWGLWEPLLILYFGSCQVQLCFVVINVPLMLKEIEKVRKKKK